MAEHNVIRGIEFHREKPTFVRSIPVNGHPMFRGTGRVWMVYREIRQFGHDQRTYTRYRVEADGKFYNPLDTLIELVPDTPIQNARQKAQDVYPDFNWQRFDELEHEAAQVAIQKLNHRPPAPIGREEPKPEMKYDNRTEIEKMTDNAIQQTGKALVQAQEVGIKTKDDMAKAVEVAYSANNNSKLERNQIMAVAALCWELGLSPNPTLGHVYGWKKGSGEKATFNVTVGIYGLINLARRDHKFILKEARDMTPDEREKNHLEPEDVGVMVGIIDGNEIDTYAQIVKAGIPVTVAEMTRWVPGIWKKKARYNSYDKVWESDNVPTTWTPRMVAEKRATRLALKGLGLNSNVGKLPEIKGYRYDADEQAYIEEHLQVEAGKVETAPEATEAPVEAQFEELLTTQVQAEQQRESVVIGQTEETAPEVPESTEPEVKAETEDKPAETVTTEPGLALRDLRGIYEAGKLGTEEIKEVPKPARIVAMLQTQVKPQLSQDTISGAIKKLITNSTLNHVTTEEYRGLLAVINAAPTADEVKALLVEEKVEA